MSWSPTNASQFAALIRQTDFWQEINTVKPSLGGAAMEDRANSATKRQMWEELVEKLEGMSTIIEEEAEEISTINTDLLNER